MPTRQFGRLGGHPRARLTSPTPSFAVFLAILDILATVGDIDSPAAATRSFGGGISWEIRDGADHWCDPDQRVVPAWLIAAQASGRQTHSGSRTPHRMPRRCSQPTALALPGSSM